MHSGIEAKPSLSHFFRHYAQSLSDPALSSTRAWHPHERSVRSACTEQQKLILITHHATAALVVKASPVTGCLSSEQGKDTLWIVYLLWLLHGSGELI